MGRQLFVPARSSRHRTAVLALYRALLQAASKSDHITDNTARRNVQHGIKLRFRTNSPYTSLRLVYAAMTAGYKYLSVLKSPILSSSTSDTYHISQILEKLSITSTPRQSKSRRNNDAQIQTTQYPKPLIFNISPPGQPPVYKSERFPRSADELQSMKDLPSLCATSLGMPFLRLRKPQARALSRMVGHKVRTFEYRVGKITEVDEDLVPEARLEDEWDTMMADLLERQRQPVEKEDHDVENKYIWSAQLTRLWWELRAEHMWQDWVARGVALNDIVEAEKQLVKRKTTMLDNRQSHGSQDTEATAKGPFAAFGPPLKRASPPRGRPNTRRGEGSSKVSAGPPMRLITKKARIYDAKETVAGDCNVDPFSSKWWTSLVEAERARMLKWAGGGPGRGSARVGDRDS